MKHGMILAAGCVIGLGGLSVSAHMSERTFQALDLQRAADEAAITASIQGYIGAFYLKQPDLLDSAVHPNLKKRDIRSTGETQYLNEMTHSQLAAMAEVANRGQWNADSRLEVEIYEIEFGIATAKATADGWIDYVHLAEINGQWQIVNVLWAPFPADED
ncbi:MAG: trehalose/maltose hydrolase-like predicted phosphorylase [Phycisphaerales bacterium]|jgi:trehalose/maltose hydrolase-like predicted phosphorylase